jgi:putative transcriptional regulator
VSDRSRRAARALLLLALLTALAAPTRAEPPRALAGRLLVATDETRDPRFARSVILLARHDAQGAMGLVINRPVGDTSLGELLAQFKLDAPEGAGRIRVHYGGPVEPARGFVLHTAEWEAAGTMRLGPSLALTTSPAILDAIARGAGPRRALFALGYCGWAPGQLEAELARGAWAVAPADEGLVFDDDPRRKWEQATGRRQLDL